MRIILFIVFYIVGYIVAKVADGGIATTTPGHSVKHLLRQKIKASRSNISEIPIKNEVTQRTIKSSIQSLLINRIDGISQNRKMLDRKFRRIRRSSRKRIKRSKVSNNQVTHENDFDNDDNDDDISSNMAKLQGPPVWQIPDSTIAKLYPLHYNSSMEFISTVHPTITRIEMMEPSFLRSPQSNNLNSDKSFNFYQTILPMQFRADSQQALDEFPVPFIPKLNSINNENQIESPAKIAILSKTPIYILSYPDRYINASKENVIFSKIPNKEYNIIGSENNDYAKGLILKKFRNKSAGYSGALSDINSPNLNRTQSFKWQFDKYQKTPLNSYNFRKGLLNNHLRKSNGEFLLVPISNNLYVLKNIADENIRANIDVATVPKQYNLLERDKDNALLLFKTHMHHDVKDIGRTYTQKDLNNNRVSGYSANNLHSDLDSDIFDDHAISTENPMSMLYSNFLYVPTVTSPMYLNLIDTVSKVSDKPIFPEISNYDYISSMDNNGNLYDSIVTHESSIFTYPSLDISRINEINTIQSYNERFLEYGLELTTIGLRNYFDALDNNVDVADTSGNVEMHSMQDIIDISRSTEDISKFSYENEDKQMSFTDDILKPYRSSFEDENRVLLLNNTYLNVDTALNDQIASAMYEKITNTDYQQSISPISEGHNDKELDRNDINHEIKFNNKSLFNDYITNVESLVNTEDYTTSVSFLSHNNEQTLKGEQFNTENVLLMAIKPLSLELQKLQDAVKTVNESISSMQEKLCNKKNVVSITMERASKKKRANIGSNRKYMNRGSDNIVHRTNNDIELKRKSIDSFLFPNKRTTTLDKRVNSNNNLDIQNNYRNFFRNGKLNEPKSFKFSDTKKQHRSTHLRLNRSLKSLTNFYETRMKSTGLFVKSKLDRMSRTMTPKFSHQIANNPSRKKHFIRKHTHDHQGYKNSTSSTSFARLPIFLNVSRNADNRTYFLSSNKRHLKQRDARVTLAREMYNLGRGRGFYGLTIPPVPLAKEKTAYLELLRLLNETHVPPLDKIRNITIPLLSIITTTELAPTTKAFFPYLEEPTISQTTSPSVYTTELSVFEFDKFTALTIDITTEELSDELITTILTEIPITEKFATESAIILTPFIEGLTDITLKIPIPMITKPFVEEISSIIAETLITEEEIAIVTKSILATSQIPFIETSRLLDTTLTPFIFITTETELTIQITTPILTIMTTEEMISVTESMSVATTITPTTIITKFTTSFSKNITSYTPMITKITYITRIETEIEDTAMTVQTSTFTSHVTLSTSETGKETTLLVEEFRTSPVETITTGIVSENATITSTEALTIETTISSIADILYTTTVKKFIDTVTKMITMTSTESTTYVIAASTTPVIQLGSTTHVIESTTVERLTISTSESTIIEYITTMITDLFTISESDETTLSTLSESVITTLSYPVTEEEGPITQIEKTIIKEEATTTETPTSSTMLLTEEESVSPSTSRIAPYRTATTMMESATLSLKTIENTTFSIFITSTITTLNETTFTKVPTTTTIESISTSLAIPNTTTPVKTFTTIPLLLVTNTTLSEIISTKVSIIPLTETVESKIPMIVTATTPTTKAVPITSFIWTTPFLSITSTLSTETFTTSTSKVIETSSVTLSTPIMTELLMDTRTASIETIYTLTFTTFSTEMMENLTSSTMTPSLSPTQSTLSIFTIMSTTETTLSIMTDVIVDTTIPVETLRTTTGIVETTISSIIYPATRSPTEISITTLIEIVTETIPYTTVFTSTMSLSMLETSTMKSATTMYKSTESYLSTDKYYDVDETETEALLTSKYTTKYKEYYYEVTTERTETTIVIEDLVTVTSMSLIEDFSPILITSEIIPVLPKTVLEEFTTISMIESTLMSYTTESSTLLFTETLVHIPINLSSIMTTEEMETEFYRETGSSYEEEYAEEYEEEEIPIDKWYEYEEHESTIKRKTTITTVKLPKETLTSLTITETTTMSSIKMEITDFSTIPTTILTNITPIAVTLTSREKLSTEEISSETFSSTILENATLLEMKTEFVSTASEEKTSVTISLTFGSTEEYTLPPSTILEFKTKPLPLEYLTDETEIKPTQTISESTSEIFRDITLPRFITKPELVPDWESELEETTLTKKVDTTISDTEVTVEKLTSFFISSTRSTIPEEETIKAYVTTIVTTEESTTTSDLGIETTLETSFEITTKSTKTKEMLITEEEPLIPDDETLKTKRTTQISTEITALNVSRTQPGFTRTTKIVDAEREEEKKRLLQQLDNLEKYEKEIAEKEKRLKEKEQQWNRKKEECGKIMQDQNEGEYDSTMIADTTVSYFITTNLTTVISTEIMTIPITTILPFTSSASDIVFVDTLTTSLYKITESSIETITSSTIAESTSVTYITTEETMEITVSSTTEESTFLTYTTEKIEKSYDYLTVTTTPYTYTTFSTDLYDIGLTTIEISAFYTTEEMYATTYGTVYSETSFTSSVLISTSPIVTVSLYEDSLTVETTTVYATEEIYTTTYARPYSEFLSISLSAFTPVLDTTLITSTIAEVEYDKELENLRRKVRRKERELAERKKMLLQREEKLEKEIAEFKKYVKESEDQSTSILSTQKSTSLSTPVPLTMSTPVPPIEETTRTTMQIKRITKKGDKQMTIQSQRETTEIPAVEEKEQTKERNQFVIPEEAITAVEEKELVTKRICLNVLENVTVSLDKEGREFATKEVCLPYLPYKNKDKKSIGRLSRKLFTFQDARETKLSDLRYRKKQKIRGSTRKISNLQLLHNEWLNEEITESTRHFKGFTRIYEETREISDNFMTLSDLRGSTDNKLQGKIPLCEGRLFNRHDTFFQSTIKAILNNKEYEKRSVYFGCNLNFKNLFDNDKENIIAIEKNNQICSRIRNISSVITPDRKMIISNLAVDGKEKLSKDKNKFYTVNVLRFGYNKNEETDKLISVKPDEDELTVIAYELSNNDHERDDNSNYIIESEGSVITKSYEKKKNNIEKKNAQLLSAKENETENENDYVNDITENDTLYKKNTKSTVIHNDKLSNDQNISHGEIIEKEAELSAYEWFTEESTKYHLGGTRFWELEFDDTDVLKITTTERSETITPEVNSDINSIIQTTCMHVVLKSEKGNNAKIKRNAYYNETLSFDISTTKMGIYNSRINEYDVSVEKQKEISRNVVKKNALHYKLRIKRSNLTAVQNVQKSCASGFHEKSSKQKIMVKPDELPNNNNDNSLNMAKGRKLCAINKNNFKHQIVKKHRNIKNNEGNNKKKDKIKPNVNLHSLKECAVIQHVHDCNKNKTNLEKRNKATVKRMLINDSLLKNISNKKHHSKVAHIDHKNRPISILHKKRIQDCLNCICDLVDVINNIKSILNKVNYPLDEIKTLNCSSYKEIQDKMIISIDSDVEEIEAFPQSHYNTELLKGQKYIKLEELEHNLKRDLELENDHDIISLPGVNLNVPCNQDGDEITWLSGINRPTYSWERTDGTTLFGFVAENGDLKLQNVNAKDTGNYTCVVTYTGPDNEEPVITTYEINLRVMTLPRYILHGENRYYVHSCEERDFDVLMTYLPLKLNSIICETDICTVYALTPFCSRNQITINVLIVPMHIVKLLAIDLKRCNIFCLKAIQDKLSFLLSKNLHIILGKTILFRLSHSEQRLVPIIEKSSFARWKRGRTSTNSFDESYNNIGLFSSCSAGYGLHGTHCVPCTVGFYSEDGISHCKKCPSGTYQPDSGARICRTCTNPLMKGCYNMLWNSFSAVMVTLASFGVMLSICLLLFWIICCAKKKLCVKHMASIAFKEGTLKEEITIEEQPLIKNTSENEDQQWNSEYKEKEKKGKFYINKRRRKQNEKKRYEGIHMQKDEWGSHSVKDTPIIYPNSYRSHEDYNNYYPKQYNLKGPRLPERDFDT